MADYVTRMGFPELQTSFDLKTVELPAVQLRAVSILREAVCEPALLMLDRPATDLSDYEAYLLLDLLRAVAPLGLAAGAGQPQARANAG